MLFKIILLMLYFFKYETLYKFQILNLDFQNKLRKYILNFEEIFFHIYSPKESYL